MQRQINNSQWLPRLSQSVHSGRSSATQILHKSKCAIRICPAMYAHARMSSWNPSWNTLESDRPQQDHPAACVVAQQCSSVTFVSSCFHSRQGKIRRPALFFFYFLYNCVTWSCLTLGSGGILYVSFYGVGDLSYLDCGTHYSGEWLLTVRIYLLLPSSSTNRVAASSWNIENLVTPWDQNLGKVSK